jgi:multidrug efflux pump
MLGVTFFGLLFTPLFYVIVRGWSERAAARRAARHPALPTAIEEH